MAFFRKIFKNIRDHDDDTVKVKDAEKPYYGTITPYPNFNASHDASVLQSAIECKGVDEDVIIAVLEKRCNEQRQRIKVVYESSTGRRLEEDLKGCLRSDFEDVTLALLMPPAHFDAYLLRKATKRFGTDEEVLAEILATRSNQEIREIKRVFKEEYRTDLEDVIKDETSGDFCEALLAMLAADKDENTDVDMDLVRKDAKKLYEAGEDAGKICMPTFISILTKRSAPQLKETLRYYKENIGATSLPKFIQAELKEDIEDCFIDIVKCAWNKPALFAEKLHKALEGHGTCEDTLIRILVGRSEIDLVKVKEEYRTMFGRGLEQDIVKDTEKHFQKILLALCGPV